MADRALIVAVHGDCNYFAYIIKLHVNVTISLAKIGGDRMLEKLLDKFIDERTVWERGDEFKSCI